MDVLDSLSEMGKSGTSDTAAKARSLHDKFTKGTTYLGLRIALRISVPLHDFNKILQAEKQTISGMLQCVKTIRDLITSFRTDEEFNSLFDEVGKKVTEYDLDPISLPRLRKTPHRYSGPATSYQPATAEDHYRQAFYVVMDATLQQLDYRFDEKATAGLKMYKRIESMLLTGNVDHEIVRAYPELNLESLEVQLKMFHQQFKPTGIFELRNTLRKMSSEMRTLFKQVESLLRLLLVCPVTSCEAERSFSGLRRLKTWLRNTMGQVKLNSVALCHVHKDRLDQVPVAEIAADFASRNEMRRRAFGNFMVVGNAS